MATGMPGCLQPLFPDQSLQHTMGVSVLDLPGAEGGSYHVLNPMAGLTRVPFLLYWTGELSSCSNQGYLEVRLFLPLRRGLPDAKGHALPLRMGLPTPYGNGFLRNLLFRGSVKARSASG